MRSSCRAYAKHRNLDYDPDKLVTLVARSPSFPLTTVRDMVDALTGAGLNVRVVPLCLDQVKCVELPLLAYLSPVASGQRHPTLVNLLQVGRRRALVASDQFHAAYLSIEELVQRWSGLVLDITGGGVRSNIGVDAYRQQVSLMREMVSEEDCRRLIDYCDRVGFRRSRVGRARDNGQIDIKVRSSSSAILSQRSEPILQKIYNQCASLARVMEEEIENIQCVRYRPAQRYRPHFDSATAFPRLKTFLIYLNDDFLGGETFFPALDLSIKPEVGACLSFPSCGTDGRAIWQSEHGGMPVERGVKYALNVWVPLSETRSAANDLALFRAYRSAQAA